MHPLLEAELREEADAEDVPLADSKRVRFRAKRHHTHHTWARTFSCLPEFYIQPETLPEIEKVVDLARRCRRRITVTGCGHSPSNMTCTSSWLVNLDRFNRILSVNASTGIVRVESGIRLYDLCAELDRKGLSMPNLGSINEQSIAGAISTGTHGSTTRHGLMSEDVLSLRITLADGTTRACDPDTEPDLFRAGLLSVGALGIVTEVTIRAVPAFSLRWQQTVDADAALFRDWPTDLWTRSEFVRVWWYPYTRRAVVWQADKTSEAATTNLPGSFNDSAAGYYIYHNLLYLSHWIPRILPWVEWFTAGMQFGFSNGTVSTAVQPSRDALLLNCLYSQYVNEWALPLHRGPEALQRLASWINRLQPGDVDYVPHGIPFSADGIYVHGPMEVRVSDSTIQKSPRPYLDPTVSDGATLYLNATLYRPYWRDPPCRERYYAAFEHLMREMGGRPHWAKNFDATRAQLEEAYGEDLDTFRGVRDEADPEGMFVGPWHRERVLREGQKLALEEVETWRGKHTDGGVLVYGSTE